MKFCSLRACALLTLTALVICALLTPTTFAQTCTTIQDGTLVGSDSATLQTGFDQWGYNYQARFFNGTYCDAYRDAPWCQDYKDVSLMMKWNEAWLDNQDCDGDSKLDRHLGLPSYIGSGAWIDNHQSGMYLDDNGKRQRWTYYVKIVAAPADAYQDTGVWYTADGVAIGPVIWGEFAIVMQVYNDTGNGEHGVSYLSPNNAGFGSYGPHQ